MWICKKCEEKIEVQFDTCWNCGYEKTGVKQEAKEEKSRLDENKMKKENDGNQSSKEHTGLLVDIENIFGKAKKVIDSGNLETLYVYEKKLIIAYEPIWAIGTGRVPTPKQIENVHDSIRSLLCNKYGTNVGNEISIIYGGSLNKDNSSEIFNIKNVDGGLVGGASLFSKSFLPIIQALESATYKR